MLWKYVHLGDVKPHAMHTQNKNSKILKKKSVKFLNKGTEVKTQVFLLPITFCSQVYLLTFVYLSYAFVLVLTPTGN